VTIISALPFRVALPMLESYLLASLVVATLMALLAAFLPE
jgi:hypothetical protein